MVEFMRGYRTAMDNIEQVKPTEDTTLDIEKPIIPIGEIGTTAIDAGNILQNFENSIRIGTKKVQFVISGQGQGVPSQLFSTWGKDVRQALREKAKATGVTITGVEVSPQMIQGLSGIDQRSGGFSEAGRQHSLNAVRDAVRFAADVSRGGGVDIYSQEFQRNILDAKWNTDPQSDVDKKWKNAFYDYTQDELKGDPETLKKLNITKYLIDERTGQPVSGSGVRVGESVTRVKFQTAKDYEALYGEKVIGRKKRPDGTPIGEKDYVDYEGNYVDQYKDADQQRLVPLIKNHNFETQSVKWETIVEETKEYNKHNHLTGDKALTTEEFLYHQKLLNEKARVEGQGLQYSQNLDRRQQHLHEMLKRKEVIADMEKKMTPEQQREYVRTSLLQSEGLPQRERESLLSKKPSEVLDEEIGRLRTQIRAEQETATSYKVAADEFDQVRKSITTPDKFAREKTFQSYKEMGIEAMQVTKDRKLEKPIYVGPEIGMASEMYGGHPDEFIELIKESRKRMAQELIDKQGMNPDAAQAKAKDHIKGMMDTSHMMMWYKHFKRKGGESDDKHIKRFNEWLIEQSKRMVKEGVVGGVQVVDTITGDHAHLPAGQGAFDVVGMVKAMKEAGFKGDIISEGHSEDSSGIGQGRILTETWRAFGSPIGAYTPGQRGGLRTWGGIQSAYFGHTPATHYIVGAYVPSNEWSLWSEVPFE